MYIYFQLQCARKKKNPAPVWGPGRLTLRRTGRGLGGGHVHLASRSLSRGGGLVSAAPVSRRLGPGNLNRDPLTLAAAAAGGGRRAHSLRIRRDGTKEYFVILTGRPRAAGSMSGSGCR